MNEAKARKAAARLEASKRLTVHGDTSVTLDYAPPTAPPTSLPPVWSGNVPSPTMPPAAPPPAPPSSRGPLTGGAVGNVGRAPPTASPAPVVCLTQETAPPTSVLGLAHAPPTAPTKRTSGHSDGEAMYSPQEVVPSISVQKSIHLPPSQ